MLRRSARADVAELRAVELMIEAARPAPLSDERREAMRLRVMSHLGPQAARPGSFPRVLRQRWAVIPAALGIAAIMLIAGQLAEGNGGQQAQAFVAHADGNVEVNGQPSSDAVAGDVILARSTSRLRIGPDVLVSMQPGAALRYDQDGNNVLVAVQSGDVTVASAAREVAVSQPQWAAAVRPSSVATFSLTPLGDTVDVSSGEVKVTSAGQTFSVTSTNSPMHIPAAAPASTITPTASNTPQSATPSPSASPSASPPVYLPPATASPSPSLSPTTTPRGIGTGTSTSTPTPRPSASPSPLTGTPTPPSNTATGTTAPSTLTPAEERSMAAESNTAAVRPTE